MGKFSRGTIVRCKKIKLILKVKHIYKFTYRFLWFKFYDYVYDCELVESSQDPDKSIRYRYHHEIQLIQ